MNTDANVAGIIEYLCKSHTHVDVFKNQIATKGPDLGVPVDDLLSYLNIKYNTVLMDCGSMFGVASSIGGLLRSVPTMCW